MQETWVQSLMGEESTGCRATKPLGHSYWACAVEPHSHDNQSQCTLEPGLCNRSPHSEKPRTETRAARALHERQARTAPTTQHSQKEISINKINRFNLCLLISILSIDLNNTNRNLTTADWRTSKDNTIALKFTAEYTTVFFMFFSFPSKTVYPLR